MGYGTTYSYFKKNIARYNKKINDSKELSQKQKKEMILPIIPLHGLRHLFAILLNYLDVNIIDISKVLGHAQTSTTMNIYVHRYEEQKRVASDKIDAFLKESA